MFNGLIDWLEAHEKLSGWAQVAGTMLALWGTAWIAMRDARERRSEEIQRMKALLHITTSIYQDARSIQSEPPGRLLAAITVRLDSLRASRMALEQFQESGMTSTFMINNLVAAKAHANRLVEIFENLSANRYERAAPRIQMSLVGLKAICENIAREVRRLGGRRERHDDPQFALWFPLSIRERLGVWWRRRQTNKLLRRARS